ncbi:MAG: HEAT repeat domain-containing protein [Verrucomicrobia bacterium]|nr:HEAT repeat domain-containing protein [Verrucomicrobiota bacterium]
MHVATQKTNATVVEVDRSLAHGDRESLDSLEHLCCGLAEHGTSCILLDMVNVRSTPSVVMATLASLQRRVRALGAEIALVHPTKIVRKAFRVTVMDDLIGLYDTEDDALGAVLHRLDAVRRQLQADLASPRKLQRLEAAAKLARIGDKDGLVLLTGFLSDMDPVVRLQGTLSLAGIGGAVVVEPLIRALADEDYRVRMYAAEALGKTADHRAIEPLRAAVRFERNRNVIFKANQALEQLLAEQPLPGGSFARA